MMINKQDEKILLRVKDNLTDCTNTLHNRKYAIENMMMRFSDLRRDVIDEVGDESSMYVDLFGNDFINNYLKSNCDFEATVETLDGLSNDDMLNKFSNRLMRLQDLDHNTVDDFVDTLNDIIDSIQEILDNEEVVDTVLIELQKLIGRGFDHDDIYCCFDNGIEVILSKVEGRVSNFEGHGMCQLWNVYYNDKDSEIYDIWVDEDDIIVDIY